MPLNSTVYLKISPESWFFPPCSFHLPIVMVIQAMILYFFFHKGLPQMNGTQRRVEGTGIAHHLDASPIITCYPWVWFVPICKEKKHPQYSCQIVRVSGWPQTVMETWNILFRLLEPGERGCADLRINYMFESRLFIIPTSLTILFYIRSCIRFIHQHFIMDRIPPSPHNSCLSTQPEIAPQKVTLVGDWVFTNVIKLKWGH